jgi:hypothetical protein
VLANCVGLQSLYGVEENFLDATYDQFYIPTEMDDEFDYTKTPSGSFFFFFWLLCF